MILLYIFLPDFSFCQVSTETANSSNQNVFNQETLQIKTLLTFTKIIWKWFWIIDLDYFILTFPFTSNYKWHLAVSERPPKLKSNIWKISSLFMQMIPKHCNNLSALLPRKHSKQYLKENKILIFYSSTALNSRKKTQAQSLAVLLQESFTQVYVMQVFSYISLGAKAQVSSSWNNTLSSFPGLLCPS